MRPGPISSDPTSPDSLVFHAALGDIVALFQSLGQPDLVRWQMHRVYGDPSGVTSLGQLAQQTASRLGGTGGFRDAIGTIDPATGTWSPLGADPTAYETVFEPSGRAAILVAAVFDAFLAIYKRRAANLVLIATQGTGVLPPGPPPPALVLRLAEEAARTARHVLRMCVRAIDYCPPLDVTFGDYLRALVTADRDLVQDDDLQYLPVFVEAFRQRGIYPRHVRTLSVESLC